MPGTPFTDIYNVFFGKITDDQFLIWTKEDTEKDLLGILIDAIPTFEFPRFPLYDYTIYTDEEKEADPEHAIDTYNCVLTQEEINILAFAMVNTWLNRQISSVELIRQKYTGSDFKQSSQANHLAKLKEWRAETERQCFHAQRLYKRRKISETDGIITPNWSSVMEKSTFDG